MPRRLAVRRPDVSRRALRVWQRNRDVYLRLWKSELVWPLAEPIITLLALGIGLGGLVELPSGQDYIAFIAPGLLAVFPMWAAAGECGWGSFFRMENQKTFDAIAATPVSVEDIITGEIMWGATRGLISSAYILVVVAAWGLLDSPLAILILPAAYLSGLMFASISLCYTSITRSISSLNYFFAIFITPMFWLGGVFFPLDRLPEGLRAASWWIPITHVVKVYRGLAGGDLRWSHLGDLAWVLVVGALFYALALFSMRRRLVR
ncbi:MAG: ABC transporter permease [Chloroflexi bacterium]|nr:ABC transporter permease [Chloroflexota bacterium]